MGGHLSHLKPEQHSEILEASCGPVRGNLYQHGDKIVDGFLGIPYANPIQRFERAKLAEIWSNPKDCTKYGPICSQFGTFPEVEVLLERYYKISRVDDENCLNLNIFKPRWENSEYKETGCPVMVFIHGGAFELGTSAAFDDYSISASLPLKDIVLVTINYRVGLLGFLTTATQECRGNFGLWDQILALEWVHKHIRSFGGDPENVTLFGQSAGGACTDLLSLSPRSRDLFHKFVTMSGSAMCHYAMRRECDAVEEYLTLARHLGYTGDDDSTSLLEWFKTQPIETLQSLQKYQKTTSGMLLFCPNMDGELFPKPLDKLRQEASPKSAVYGLCEFEGLMFATEQTSEPNSLLQAELKKFYKKDNVGKMEEEVRQRIYDFYSGDEGGWRSFTHFIGDQLFNVGIFEGARNAAKHGNDVYVYSFEHYNPDYEYGEFAAALPFTNGATHSTDLRYLLYEGDYAPFNPNDEDRKVMEIMATIFSNFAKYGNPNITGASDWTPINEEHPDRHYRIALPKCELRNIFQDNRLNFLAEILRDTSTHKDLIDF